MIANSNQIVFMLQIILKHKNSKEVFYINFKQDRLIAKIGLEIYKNIKNDFEGFKNITFEKSLTSTKIKISQECVLVEWLAFNDVLENNK